MRSERLEEFNGLDRRRAIFAGGVADGEITERL